MNSTLFLSGLVASQIFLSVIAQIVTLRLIGVGDSTDAYVASQAIPTFLTAIAIAGLQAACVGAFATTTEAKAGSGVAAKLPAALGQATALAIFIIAFGAVLIIFLAGSIFPGFTTQQLHDSVNFSLMFLVAAGPNIAGAVLALASRYEGHFSRNELVGVGGALLSFIAIYFVVPSAGLYGAASIWVAKSILVFLVQLALFRWPKISVWDGLAKAGKWRHSNEILLGSAIYKSAPVVDRYWASRDVSGGVTALGLSQTAIGALTTILDRAYSSKKITSLTRCVARGEWEALRSGYRRCLIEVLAFATLLLVALLTLKTLCLAAIGYLIHVDAVTSGLIWTLIVASIGVVFSSVTGAILASVLYAFQATRAAVVIGIFGFGLGILLKYLLFSGYGLPGVVLSSSAYLCLNVIAFVCWVEFYIGGRRRAVSQA